MTDKENIVTITVNFSMVDEYIKPSGLIELLKDLNKKFPEWIITFVDGELG